MAGIKVGKPDVDIEKPSHTKGIKQGNAPGSYDSQPGHFPDGRSDAERSTGIQAKQRNPILPAMPNLSPP